MCVQVRLCPDGSPVRKRDLGANEDASHDYSLCRALKARLRYTLPMKLCMVGHSRVSSAGCT